ncbi:MAG: NADH-quinone oxidoreductase subunit C [Chloroflexota bacterium]
MTTTAESLAEAIPGSVTAVAADGITNVLVPADGLVNAVRALRDDLGFVRFIDLTCVDDPGEDERFELQYLLYSMDEHRWLRVKCRTADAVPSITPLMAGANWYEREVYDLFGVRFEGHPKLTRLMMPDDWEGYPLRKDAPKFWEPVDFKVTRPVYGPPEGREGYA